jgi:3D (Asp-Asp-Asp) domain-containing protein
MKRKLLLTLLCLLLCGCEAEQMPTEPPIQPVVTVQDEEVVAQVSFGAVYCSDPSLPAGQEEVVFAGVPGQQREIYLATYENGIEVSRELTAVIPILEPVDAVIAVGTGQTEARRWPLLGDGFLVTPEGEMLPYTHAEQFRAVAYTSWVADTTGTTATGTVARVGAIAVDPTVIPYWTKMYIVTQDGEYIYGVAVAEDCGTAIKGKWVDLFLETYEEACEFGRRQVDIYFLA